MVLAIVMHPSAGEDDSIFMLTRVVVEGSPALEARIDGPDGLAGVWIGENPGGLVRAFPSLSMGGIVMDHLVAQRDRALAFSERLSIAEVDG